eukprot:m51a1_g2852 hypothetical protein (123) ;mRNA; f:304081-304449
MEEQPLIAYQQAGASLAVTEQNILKLLHVVADAVEELSNMPYITQERFAQSRNEAMEMAQKVRHALHTHIDRIVVPAVPSEFSAHSERMDAEIALDRDDVILARLRACLLLLDSQAPHCSST